MRRYFEAAAHTHTDKRTHTHVPRHTWPLHVPPNSFYHICIFCRCWVAKHGGGKTSQSAWPVPFFKFSSFFFLSLLGATRRLHVMSRPVTVWWSDLTSRTIELHLYGSRELVFYHHLTPDGLSAGQVVLTSGLSHVLSSDYFCIMCSLHLLYDTYIFLLPCANLMRHHYLLGYPTLPHPASYPVLSYPFLIFFPFSASVQHRGRLPKPARRLT